MTAPCGTRARYVKGCKCDDCRAANTAYQKARYRRQVRPDEELAPAFVPAGRARSHLELLAEHGIGKRRAAELAGLSYSVVDRIRRGDIARCRPETIEKILAVPPNPLLAAAAGAHVPAGPAWAHIRRLLDAGWTKARISAAIGQGGKSLQVGRREVTVETARKIAALAETIERTRDQRTLRALVEDRAAFYDRLADVLEERQEPWRERALCRSPNIPARIFFPARGESADAALRVCARCPVTEECAEYAERFDTRLAGVWGGTTGRQRRGAA